MEVPPFRDLGAGRLQPEEWVPLLKRIRDGDKLCRVYVTAKMLFPRMRKYAILRP